MHRDDGYDGRGIYSPLTIHRTAFYLKSIRLPDFFSPLNRAWYCYTRRERYIFAHSFGSPLFSFSFFLSLHKSQRNFIAGRSTYDLVCRSRETRVPLSFSTCDTVFSLTRKSLNYVFHADSVAYNSLAFFSPSSREHETRRAIVYVRRVLRENTN